MLDFKETKSPSTNDDLLEIDVSEISMTFWKSM